MVILEIGESWFIGTSFDRLAASFLVTTPGLLRSSPSRRHAQQSDSTWYFSFAACSRHETRVHGFVVPWKVLLQASWSPGRCCRRSSAAAEFKFSVDFLALPYSEVMHKFCILFFWTISFPLCFKCVSWNHNFVLPPLFQCGALSYNFVFPPFCGALKV